MADTTPPPDTTGRPPGAILSETQIARLRVAVTIMTAILILGIAVLIGRVIYLASGAREQSTGLVSEATLTLPAGASLKSSALAGPRLAAHYAGPSGEGILVLDLATGRTISHIRIAK